MEIAESPLNQKTVVEVMFNKCFGGFQVSQEAVDKYILIKKMTGVDMSNVDVFSLPRGIDRTDEVMIEIVKELGEKANCKYSEIKIKSFPYKYKDYIEIGEYDGYESAEVNFKAYKLETIKKICFDSNEINQEAKLIKIMEILQENEDES
jgi:hypothetical protein